VTFSSKLSRVKFHHAAQFGSVGSLGGWAMPVCAVKAARHAAQ